ncbi:unnamed protein product, partial [Wuchereria bancrofti]
KNPFECALRVLPYFYWFCIAFNTFAISYQGSKILHLAKLPLWLCLLISAAVATVITFAIHFLMVPKLRKWIEKKGDRRIDQSASTDLPNITGQVELADGIVQIFIPHNNGLCSDEVNNKAVVGKRRSVSALKHFVQWFLPDKKHEPDSKTTLVFGSIQAFTACFEGFAHGANDVAGFTIEFGAAVTALLASKAGLPISTTHCLVGSVVAVGVIKSRGAGVRWSIFRNIFLSWVVTLPASGIVAAGSMLLMKFLL